MFKRILLVLLVVLSGLYLLNASWLAKPEPPLQPKLIAHRGVHQTFHRKGLTNDTCTAQRIHTPTHSFLENTIPSMQVAFAAGAEIVELDIHPTTDGKLAIFHDWTLDCRTNGTGETRTHSMAELKKLDIGYGYTADNGKTYPFRGKGVGLMPELSEVFRALPDKQFLINFKGSEEKAAKLLEQLLQQHPQYQKNIWAVYGAPAPTRYVASRFSTLRGFDKPQTKTCLTRYIAIGWTGYVPETCKNTVVGVPQNYTWAIWGWPHRFAQRLQTHNSQLLLSGPLHKGVPSGGIDTTEQAAAVSADFPGYILTNTILQVAPLITAESN